jgi:hypothetical protein
MSVSQHAEWLSLVEISGPFVVPNVLHDAMPQGLDGGDTDVRRKLRNAYDEWRNAVDDEDRDMPALHAEWVRLVMEELLEYDDHSLRKGADVPDELACRAPSADVTVKPDQVVVADGATRMCVFVHPPDTDLESKDTKDGWDASHRDRATRALRAAGVEIGLVTNGDVWTMIYAAKDVPTGYASFYARAWRHEPLLLQAFSSLLGVRRCFGPEEHTVEALCKDSLTYQDEVTSTLGEQVRRAVEVLVQALDRADVDRNRELLADVGPRDLYEAGLTIMMRLVFLMCAEERGLLMLGDEKYDSSIAVSTLRRSLREQSDKLGPEVLERRHDAWSRLLTTFRAIYGGVEHEDLWLPALGGGLLDPDRYPFLEGRASGTSWETTAAVPLPIDNRTVLLLLDAIQVLQHRGGAQTLSYRALDVEQIGYVYEGLLEYTVKRMTDATLGLRGSKKIPYPNVSLNDIEAARADGEETLASLLKEATGRSSFRTDLDTPADEELAHRVATSCGGDTKLYERTLPYARLLRTDAWGYPVVYPAGSFAVTHGMDRRETGTHYTPKSLVEKIVEETLTPVAYVGPAEGTPEEDWKLKSTEELLDLKICDPAMGSGAFLVQVCRWLGERVVEAWNASESEGKAVTDEGLVKHALEGDDDPAPKDADGRDLLARSLVAERCIYGVDKNPLAVELARLSIWLVTLSKGRPFAFLDHNLRSGDSLLGIHRLEDLTSMSMTPEQATRRPRLFGEQVTDAVNEAIELRGRLRQSKIVDIRDVRAMHRLEERARRTLEAPSLIADAMIADALYVRGAPKALDSALDRLSVLADGYVADAEGTHEAEIRTIVEGGLAVDLPVNQSSRRPFHWALEFPEVFQRPIGGFDAIIGNPPFLGGSRISGALGTGYRHALIDLLADGTKGLADLVAYFYLRAYSLLRHTGCLGMLAVNSISQGDTRSVGLERMLHAGADIYSAHPNEPWAGSASVVTSRVHLVKDAWAGRKTLGRQVVPTISAFLSDQDEWTPRPLRRNSRLAFKGSMILGMGFVMDTARAREHIEEGLTRDDVLLPYLIGRDVNSHPDQEPARWVISFWDWPLDRSAEGTWATAGVDQRSRWISSGHAPPDYTGPVAADFPTLLNIVEETVRPERQRRDTDGSYIVRYPRSQRWWQHGELSKGLYDAIGRSGSFCEYVGEPQPHTAAPEHVMVCSQVTKYFSPVLVANNAIFDQRLVCFALNSRSDMGAIASGFHEAWARKQASTLRTDLTYTPSRCFETFPLPSSVESIAELFGHWHEVRQQAMRNHRVGLTGLLNKVHDRTDTGTHVVAFRDVSCELDQAVASAYGWPDLDLNHAFHEVPNLPGNDRTRFTISEPARIEVLRRLSELNKQRYEEEVAQGLHDKKNLKGTRARRKKAATKSVPTPQRELILDAAAPSSPTSDDPTQAIVEYLRAHSGLTPRASILADTSLTESQWEPAITQLVANGLVVARGFGPGAMYFLTPKGKQS